MSNIFVGTKIVKALAMTRLDYNAYRGWDLPAGENGADEGYLIEYTDGGSSNHKDHAGYISWSPKEQFDKAYRATKGVPFFLALEAIRIGHRAYRAGWQDGKLIAFDQDSSHINLHHSSGEVEPGYHPDRADLFSDDWVILAE